jgi:hypothetical protein
MISLKMTVSAMSLRRLPEVRVIIAFLFVALTWPAMAAEQNLAESASVFIKRSAIDGSLSIELPSNWFYTAQGGHIIATSPLGRAGVLFKVFAVSAKSDGLEPQPNVINSAYRPPPAFIHDVLAQYRYRSIRVLGWQSDESAARRCRLAIKRDCEAADVIVRWISVEGTHCVGALKLVNATPTPAGQWFSVVAGVWGPTQALALDLPTLERAASSLASVDNTAKAYLNDALVQIRLLSTNRRP